MADQMTPEQATRIEEDLNRMLAARHRPLMRLKDGAEISGSDADLIVRRLNQELPWTHPEMKRLGQLLEANVIPR